MSGKPVVLRERAQRDVDAAVAYYASPRPDRQARWPSLTRSKPASVKSARIRRQARPTTRTNWTFPAYAFGPLESFPIWFSMSSSRRKSMSGASFTERVTWRPGCGNRVRTDVFRCSAASHLVNVSGMFYLQSVATWTLPRNGGANRPEGVPQSASFRPARPTRRRSRTMSTMRVRIDPDNPATLPDGRFDPAVVDGTHRGGDRHATAGRRCRGHARHGL